MNTPKHPHVFEIPSRASVFTTMSHEIAEMQWKNMFGRDKFPEMTQYPVCWVGDENLGTFYQNLQGVIRQVARAAEYQSESEATALVGVDRSWIQLGRTFAESLLFYGKITQQTEKRACLHGGLAISLCRESVESSHFFEFRNDATDGVKMTEHVTGKELPPRTAKNQAIEAALWDVDRTGSRAVTIKRSRTVGTIAVGLDAIRTLPEFQWDGVSDALRAMKNSEQQSHLKRLEEELLNFGSARRKRK